jgi:hypothetical protein
MPACEILLAVDSKFSYIFVGDITRYHVYIIVAMQLLIFKITVVGIHPLAGRLWKVN